MDDSTSREKVLKKIRNASIYKNENPFMDIDFNSPVFAEVADSPDIAFAREFSRIAGKFVYCESDSEFCQNLSLLMQQRGLKSVFCLEPSLQQLLQQEQVPYESSEEQLLHARAGLTACEFLIARLGSIMVSSRQASGRRLPVFPDLHIVHAYSSQIVPDLQDALSGIRQKYAEGLPSLVSVISGPSRTADIEKTLVMGAHGPRDVYVFLVDDTNNGS
jgi:L-lactate dehydrogenase complex protein LldG